jgi:hypothetical protein
MPNEWSIEHQIGVQSTVEGVDRIIAELAHRQHGVVARRQLIRAGLGRRMVERRLEAGRLHVVQRGVYAVGHRVVNRHGQWMAAVLSAGRMLF